MEVIYVPWSKALRMCYRLAELVIDSGYDVEVIVTISRGGLIPARIVSDVLGVDEFYTIRSKFWGIGGRIAPEPIIKMYEGVEVRNKRVLLVDEVVDTGATMTKVVRILQGLKAKEVRTAVLHYKLTSSLRPDYYVEEVRKWVWIFYPWSLSETLYELVRSSKGGTDANALVKGALDLMNRLGVNDAPIDPKYLEKSLQLYIKHNTSAS